MKVFSIISALVLLVGFALADESIKISPIPPIGATITRDSEGVIRIEMTDSGTVILGTSEVNSREGNRPDSPSRYHIEFKSMGKVVAATGGSDVSLVVYLDRGAFGTQAAHGGKVLLSNTKDWQSMRTSFLAKGSGAVRVEKVILGIYFKEPGTVELKDLSCQAVDLPIN